MEKTCFCRNKFIDNSSNKVKKYCSKKCSDYKENERMRLLRAEKNKNKINKLCKLCNLPFIDKSDNNVGKYCSDSCRSKNNYNLNQEKRNLQISQWAKNNRNKKNNINKNYAKNNPSQIKARKLIQEDKKKNPHLYPEICMICGSTTKIEFHHPDYNFPYSVYPVCKAHHQEIHNNINTTL